MKKIISVLLSIIIAVAVPFAAFANDIVVSSDEVLSNDATLPKIDYNAFDSVITLVNAVDENQYTTESYNALMATVVDRDSLLTQDAVDNAVNLIASAYSSLVKKTFAVTFKIVDSNENVKSQEFTYSYGDVANFEVTGTDESVIKWVLSTDDADEKIDATGNSVSLVITKGANVIAMTDAKPSNSNSVSQIKFLSISGKVIDIAYTADPENIEMPNAPKVPFYYFDKWEKINDTTYKAKYTSTLVCDGEKHIFKVTIFDPSCDGYGYLLFECECGESYATEFQKPHGHSYDNDEQYCLNGCGRENDAYFELHPPVASQEPTTDPTTQNPTEPTTEPEQTPEVNVDDEGYINWMVMP